MEQNVTVGPDIDGIRVITCTGEFDQETLEPRLWCTPLSRGTEGTMAPISQTTRTFQACTDPVSRPAKNPHTQTT